MTTCTSRVLRWRTWCPEEQLGLDFFGWALSAISYPVWLALTCRTVLLSGCFGCGVQAYCRASTKILILFIFCPRLLFFPSGSLLGLSCTFPLCLSHFLGLLCNLSFSFFLHSFIYSFILSFSLSFIPFSSFHIFSLCLPYLCLFMCLWSLICLSYFFLLCPA